MSLTKDMESKYIANTYARFDICINSAKGDILIDENGNEYIDMASGIAVNTFGGCDEEWVNAVINQLKTLVHTSNLYYTKPQAKLAKILCEKTNMKKVFFSNSGAEANECAIKIARKYASEKKGEDYYNIVTLNGSFHGRTITTLSATGQECFHNQFKPLTQGFLYANPNNFEQIESIVKNNKCAGIMLEVIQGEGGVNALEYDYLKKIEKLAHENDLLLIVDEVQCGNGRTGKLYGFMNFDITPDIITTAKGLGGGLPIGATIIGEKAQNTFNKGDHGSTFGGNPLCCASAINIINRIDDKLLNEVKEKSDFIIKSLNGQKGIISITGMGLMLGITTQKNAQEIVNECQQNGVLVIKAKDKIRLLPPLNISMKNLKIAVNVLKKACENY